MEMALALVNAQGIESMLVNLFAIAEIGNGAKAGDEHVGSIMETRYAQTLGRVLKDAAASLNLDPELVDGLFSALSKRNWLVHNSMREYYPAVENADLRRIFYLKLKRMRQEFERLSSVLHNLCLDRMAALGRDREEIEASVRRKTEEYTRELLARDSAA